MSQQTNIAPKVMLFTSVNQLIQIVKTRPEVVAAVPRLSQLAAMEYSTSPKKSCNCGSKQNFTTPDTNKQVAESLLSSLSSEDFGAIKSALNLDKLCYYKRNTEQNKLEMVCL